MPPQGDVLIRRLNNLSWLRLTQRVVLSELLTCSAQVREDQVRLLFSTTVQCKTSSAADIICQNHPQKHAAAHLTKYNASTCFQQKTSCVLGVISLTNLASWHRHSFSFSPAELMIFTYFCHEPTSSCL